MALQHLRSSTADKRPTPAAMSDGQLALNTNLVSPGLFFKDSNGDSVKIGPVHVGTTAPNVTPGAGGQAGNSKGEAWLDTTATNPILKVWNGSAFVAVQPVGTGTVVSTTDSGTVTSTMILDGTILNADINASAAIVDTKLATIATAGKVSNSATTATNANTASAIVARDASGNFTAGTITAAVTGAASSNVLKAGDTMTGALVVPLASAATPSLTFTGDLNTGFWSPSADALAASTAGAERLRITSAGLVGIGTSAPGGLLELSSNASGTLAGEVLLQRIRSNASNLAFLDVKSRRHTAGSNWEGVGFRFQHQVDATAMGFIEFNSLANGQDVAIGTVGSTRLLVNSSGNVGIGTSAPDVGLHYRGDTPKLRIESSNTLDTSLGTEEIGRLEWEGSRSTNVNAAASIRARQDGTWSTVTPWISPSALEFYTQNNTGVEVTTPRMLIDSSGRVGIGTTSPVATLHVENTAGGDLFYALGSSSDVFKISSDSSTINLDTRNTTGGLAFQIQGTERARIDTSGRLLVGTSSAFATRLGASPITPGFQVKEGGAGSALFFNGVNGASPATIYTVKSRGATYGTIVQNNDNLFRISAAGDDGVQATEAARIDIAVDGTPGANDMPGRIVLSTTANGASTPTERMRITNQGAINLNTTSGADINVASGTTDGITFYGPGGPGGVFQVSNNTNACAFFRRRGSDGTIIDFRRDTTAVGYISVTTTATAYNTSSDYRLKENIAPVSDGITRLQQLKPSRFNFIADPDTVVDGFLAHEVQTIVPEAISGEKDAVDDDGNPEYQGIDQSKIVPLLTAALQEAIAKIEVLEQRLNDAGIN
jgi:hypothetical protein